jgi:hypothetical protein
LSLFLKEGPYSVFVTERVERGHQLRDFVITMGTRTVWSGRGFVAVATGTHYDDGLSQAVGVALRALRRLPPQGLVWRNPKTALPDDMRQNVRRVA